MMQKQINIKETKTILLTYENNNYLNGHNNYYYKSHIRREEDI